MPEEISPIIPNQVVVDKIYEIRGCKIMLDSDLAELYDVETKRLNEQVRRNPNRFPEDLMFQLTEKEWFFLRSQFATSKIGRGGRKYLPFAFTEHGILMLSSDHRIFTHLRTLLSEHAEYTLRFKSEGMVRTQLSGTFIIHDLNRGLSAVTTIKFTQRFEN